MLFFCLSLGLINFTHLHSYSEKSTEGICRWPCAKRLLVILIFSGCFVDFETYIVLLGEGSFRVNEMPFLQLNRQEQSGIFSLYWSSSYVTHSSLSKCFNRKSTFMHRCLSRRLSYNRWLISLY